MKWWISVIAAAAVLGASALAYFVGPDPSIIQLFGNTANSMGLVRFTDAKGQVGYVEKTFTFVREMNGTLRIVLHHSSAPFDAR